jgi:proline iminopeptidase
MTKPTIRESFRKSSLQCKKMTINFGEGSYIETQIGAVYTRTIGYGKPLIIVHGGPGLEHSYLVKWLTPLADKRQLIFYDQCGCGQDKTPISRVSASLMVDQLMFLIEALHLNSDVGFFSHSWGDYIVLSLLERYSSVQVREAIFANPMGLTAERFEESGQRLIAKVPEHIMTQLGEISSKECSELDSSIMDLLLPYYVASSNFVPDIHFLSYSNSVYEKVVESLGNFDVREQCSYLPEKTLVMYGAEDFEIPDGSAELKRPGSKVHIIPRSGHFTFAEAPDVFLKTVFDFL